MFKLGFLLLALEILVLTRSPAFGLQTVSGPFPIPAADVYAYNNNGSGSESSFTNSTGGYLMNNSLTGIGTYTVEASANGFVTTDANTTISSLSNKNTVDLILNRSAIIEGKVLGKNGHPVVGAYVKLFENSTSTEIDESQTDSNGMYYFATNVATGAYYITVTFDFSSTVFDWYQADPHLANGYVEGTSQTISATQGAITVAPNIILNSSGVITGTVEQSGHPIANATVTATLSESPFYSMTVTTASNGTYRISYDIVNGTYTVTPYAIGFAGDSTTINATQTGTVTQNLAMFKTATLSGHVSRTSDNKPVPSVDIEVSNDTSTHFWDGFGSTNDSGNYAISAYDGLGPGNYTVYALLQDDYFNTTSIILTAGENATLNFNVDAYFISGTVYNATIGGTPLPYADVSLSFSSLFYLLDGYTSGGANGTYLLALPTLALNGETFPGNFTVSAGGYVTKMVPANITIGTDLTQNFALQKKPPPTPMQSAAITGTVYGNSGPPLPFSYETWYASDSGYQFMMTMNSSSYISGVYTDLSAKSLYVDLWGPEGINGSLTIWIPDAIYFGTFLVTSYPGPNPQVVTTTDNGTYTKIQITYALSPKTIIFTSTGAVPEFPSSLALAALMVTLLFAAGIAIFLQKRLKASYMID